MWQLLVTKFTYSQFQTRREGPILLSVFQINNWRQGLLVAHSRKILPPNWFILATGNVPFTNDGCVKPMWREERHVSRIGDEWRGKICLARINNRFPLQCPIGTLNSCAELIIICQPGLTSWKRDLQIPSVRDIILPRCSKWKLLDCLWLHPHCLYSHIFWAVSSDTELSHGLIFPSPTTAVLSRPLISWLYHLLLQSLSILG